MPIVVTITAHCQPCRIGQSTCLHIHSYDGLLQLSSGGLVGGGIASNTSCLHLGKRLCCSHVGGPAKHTSQTGRQISAAGKSETVLVRQPQLFQHPHLAIGHVLAWRIWKGQASLESLAAHARNVQLKQGSWNLRRAAVGTIHHGAPAATALVGHVGNVALLAAGTKPQGGALINFMGGACAIENRQRLFVKDAPAHAASCELRQLSLGLLTTLAVGGHALYWLQSPHIVSPVSTACTLKLMRQVSCLAATTALASHACNAINSKKAVATAPHPWRRPACPPQSPPGPRPPRGTCSRPAGCFECPSSPPV